jgi:hypothetical protein
MRDFHRAADKVFSTPEGKQVLEFLRTQCFMKPGPQSRKWEGSDQVMFRFGRMTLFQALEYYLDPQNFEGA